MVDAQYATGDQWRNNSRKKKGTQPKQKQHPDVAVTGERSRVRCCKEHYCIGTWNVRSMNQGKLEVVNRRWQEWRRHLGIRELKYTGMCEFNLDDHYIYCCGQQSLRRNGVAIMGTYQPEEFLFQYLIILPFHTVHGVHKARILKWFAIPFFSGPHFVRTLHHDPSILGGPTRHRL